jgi:hypothetical protein
MRIVLVILSVSACTVGPSAKHFAPATAPDGIEVDLRVPGFARVQGELLEVQDSGLVILRNDRVTFVPLGDIQYGNFRQRGTLVTGGRFVDATAATELRLVSRFPAGLTPERRAALLAAYGQTAPDRVTQ